MHGCASVSVGLLHAMQCKQWCKKNSNKLEWWEIAQAGGLRCTSTVLFSSSRFVDCYGMLYATILRVMTNAFPKNFVWAFNIALRFLQRPKWEFDLSRKRAGHTNKNFLSSVVSSKIAIITISRALSCKRRNDQKPACAMGGWEVTHLILLIFQLLQCLQQLHVPGTD